MVRGITRNISPSRRRSPPPSRRSPRWAAFARNGAGALALGLCLSLGAGCASGTAKSPATAGLAHGPVNPTPVSEAEFAGKVYQLLLDGEPSSARHGDLIGAVRHQFARAARRFEDGEREGGLKALTGAFFLMRAGEFRPEMLENAAPALSAGAAEVARLGHEGYARALYGMLASILPKSPERSEVEQHLGAIADFSKATRGDGAMQAAAADMRAATQQAIYEATPQALESARDKATIWLKRALDSNVGETPIQSSMERDEAIEAYRALRGGGYAVVALYLRHGDPKAALAALDRASLSRLVMPELRDRLERAADENDPESWADLFRLYDSARNNADGLIDSDLVMAGVWGAALGLYRSEPNSMQGAMPLATLLIEYGMAEVAPLVLGGALSKDSDAESLSIATAIVLRAIVSEEQLGQLEAARRTFAGAEPIMKLARDKAHRGRVNPSPARLSYVMGALETRHGELGRAREHILFAAQTEPTIEAWMTLAAIERQRKSVEAAIGALDKAIELARRSGDALAETEASIARFEIYRDHGDSAQAGRILEYALNRALEAQRLGRNGPAQARAERLLARVLEQYREYRAIRRATARAYEAAGSDPRQMAATVLDSARRALTLTDLAAARAAVQRAVEAGLPSEDLVYVAVWLQLIERKLNVPSDGTVEEAYAAIEDASGWPAKLRSWARGKISDEELLASAKDRAQRTEAIFYAAMARHVGGGDALPYLTEVAQSEAIDLVEVTIARDLLASKGNAALDFKLPPNVAVP